MLRFECMLTKRVLLGQKPKLNMTYHLMQKGFCHVWITNISVYESIHIAELMCKINKSMKELWTNALSQGCQMMTESESIIFIGGLTNFRFRSINLKSRTWGREAGEERGRKKGRKEGNEREKEERKIFHLLVFLPQWLQHLEMVPFWLCRYDSIMIWQESWCNVLWNS